MIPGRVILLILCVACGRPAPNVRIVAPTSSWEYLAGAEAWLPLGFRPTLGQCERCQVVTIYRRPNMPSAGLADRATDTILIDARWSGWPLVALVAHELGHVLLDTGRHAEGRGVMSAKTAEWQLQPADYALACAVGVCR